MEQLEMTTASFLILPLLIIVLLAAALIWQRKKMEELEYRFLAKKEWAREISQCMIEAGFFDNILEADITNNRLIGANCVNLTQMLGIPSNTSFSDCIETIIHKMVRKEYHALYRESFDRKELQRKYETGKYMFSIEFVEKSNMVQENWTRATVCLYYSKVTKTIRLISYVNNIQREMQRELGQRYLINTDNMTGLLNKKAVEERICSLLKEDARTPRHHALLVIDVDYFKQVNDTIGHAGGDYVLTTIAHLIEKNFRVDDIVGRIGGDEFLVLMRDCGRRTLVAERAERLNACVASRETAEKVGMYLSLSIGIALFPEHGRDFLQLFQTADQALYYVKEHNRNGYCIYDSH